MQKKPGTDPVHLANQIQMDARSQGEFTFLLVEGRTDIKAFRPFFDADRSDLVPTNGKRIALRTLRLLRERRFAGCLTIVDRDYDDFTGTLDTSPGVHYTDTHDVESLILRFTIGLERVLLEYDLFRTLGPVEELRIRLLNAAMPLGLARLLNEVNGWNLAFQMLDYLSFIDARAIECSVTALLDKLIRGSPDARVDHRRLESTFAAAVGVPRDAWLVCCGHDLTTILGLVLARHSGGDVTREHVERALRLGFDCSSFARTGLWATLNDWQHTAGRTIASPDLRRHLAVL